MSILSAVPELNRAERWRTALGADDLRTFDAVAGAMNRRLGYT